ncbi:MAG: NAD(P)-binding domain-containing protein, partial [Fimbriimonadaceae bacterium]|nr:NAD(P)-binding domain-containing protein [Alphaproteobacteria bacterium]
MSNKHLQVAFLGTGLMGQPMARRLIEADFDVTVWNRSPDKTLPLADAGAKTAPNPGTATKDKDVVITMLTDGQSVEHVLFE